MYVPISDNIHNYKLVTPDPLQLIEVVIGAHILFFLYCLFISGINMNKGTHLQATEVVYTLIHCFIPLSSAILCFKRGCVASLAMARSLAVAFGYTK